MASSTETHIHSIPLFKNDKFEIFPILETIKGCLLKEGAAIADNKKVVAGNISETTLHTLHMNQLQFSGSSSNSDEESETELTVLLQEFEKRELQFADGDDGQKECISFKTRHNKQEKVLTFLFEIEPKLMQYLNGLSSFAPILFEVEGEIISDEHRIFLPAKKDVITTFSLKTLLLEERRGEILRLTEDYSLEVGRNVYRILTKPTLLDKLTFNWSMTISWRYEMEQPITAKLGSLASNLFSNEETKDLTIIAGDGSPVKCHKLVFAMYSPVFSAMVSSKTGMKESTSSQIELADMSHNGLNYLVSYFYEKPFPMTEIRSALAVELFQAAHKYGLSELEDMFEKLLLKKDTYWFTADSIVELYYFARKLEKFKSLEKHCLKVMTRMHNQIRSCQRFQELENKEVVELIWRLFECK